MRKIIITAAVTGSRPTKAMNPAVPYSPEEIAEEAIRCHSAGAAVAHIRVRDPRTGEPSFKLEYFKEVMDRIREKCDILINLTTSGLMLTGPDIITERLKPLTLKPEICSLDIGSLNFLDRVFYDPPEWGEIAAKTMLEAGVKPEIEVFDSGHISQALDIHKRGLFQNPPYFQLCMGTRWGMEATPEDVLFIKSKLPPDSVWSVLGVGKHQLATIAMGILLGGHIRVGFEDNIYLRKGILAKNNAEQVEMAVKLIESLQCTIASSSDARFILKITPQ